MRGTVGRRRIASGTPWESTFGYSRAVRIGPHVWVSGTTSTGPDGVFVDGSAYEQARRALENISRALTGAGGGMSDVVRTRCYVRDIAEWPEVGRAHAERFARILPAMSLVEVRGLIDPRMRVEIEAEAYVAPLSPSRGRIRPDQGRKRPSATGRRSERRRVG
ncbi:MAG TPA: RidA family protein [Thermoplasmata archaeon]|nr:RidA family protein [Thermoplasmata archaeon]